MKFVLMEQIMIIMDKLIVMILNVHLIHSAEEIALILTDASSLKEANILRLTFRMWQHEEIARRKEAVYG
ncbi:MAG: hypothetical protein A2X67_08585 [Ignavibacteria bacterium GWA2_55_11]|nr:MAG: hypothetical protein A2X67_08585 [Ignavibacteria bacterium GWA2_55_11]